MYKEIIRQIPPERPVLIAGSTASGKSALALAIAEAQGGVIVNADALQVYENWLILTARPAPEDLARAPHALYGHVGRNTAYSAGQWLRELTPLLGGGRAIITGGTGLYFSALTEGLADIPQIPHQIRAEASARLKRDGLATLLGALDPATAARIDAQNPARVLRAWEVERATGRALAEWHADTPAPLLPLSGATALLIEAPRDWLNARIEQRFARMLETGALEEARANLADWNPALASSRAIGAGELIAHLRGEIPLEQARRRAIIATRQYAKRQRSWWRARMSGWTRVNPD